MRQIQKISYAILCCFALVTQIIGVELRVGATPVPAAEILEFTKP